MHRSTTRQMDRTRTLAELRTYGSSGSKCAFLVGSLSLLYVGMDCKITSKFDRACCRLKFNLNICFCKYNSFLGSRKPKLAVHFQVHATIFRR